MTRFVISLSSSGKPAAASSERMCLAMTDSRVVWVSRQRKTGRQSLAPLMSMLSVSTMRSTSNGEGLTGTKTKSLAARHVSVVSEKARSINDDGAARDAETACRFAGVLGRVLDNGHPAEPPFARGEACDRALRIGIDDRRVASIKMPMNRKAACERAFAAAALHGCHRDDRAHLSSGSRPPTQRIIRIDVIVFLKNCLLLAIFG